MYYYYNNIDIHYNIIISVWEAETEREERDSINFESKKIFKLVITSFKKIRFKINTISNLIRLDSPPPHLWSGREVNCSFLPTLSNQPLSWWASGISGSTINRLLIRVDSDQPPKSDTLVPLHGHNTEI